MSSVDFCCIPTCPNHNYSGQDVSRSYFPFPTIPHLLYQWMRIILDPHNSKVCSEHFANTDMIDVGQDLEGCRRIMELKEGAVPTYILRTGTCLLQSETPGTRSSSSPTTKAKKSRKSPKVQSATRKPAAIGEVEMRKELDETAAVKQSKWNKDKDTTMTTTGSSLLKVHKAEEPRSDQEQVVDAASSSMSEASIVKEGDKRCANYMVIPNEDSSGLPWVCRKCQKSFAISIDLTRHLSKVHNVLVFPCKDCKKQFQSNQKLKAHKTFCGKGIEVPNRKQLSKVDLSDANTSRKVQLASKSATHQVDHSPMVTSDVDGGTHQAELNSSTAQNIPHSRPKKIPVFQCEKCGKCVKSSSSFKYHTQRACPMLSAVVEIHRKHKCETCGEGFRSKMQLADHSRVHYKTLKCEICEKRYFKKHNFIRHLQTHLDWQTHTGRKRQ